MQAVTTIGLDIAKSVFQVHGVDAEGNVVIRRQLKRRYVLVFFQKLPPCYHRLMPAARRFPPPWIVEEHAESFIVRGANGQALAYFYFEEEPGRRSAAKLLTRDEARRMAANFAKLPKLLRKE
jgi:hypothetical protein